MKWEKLFKRQILERGYEYYQKGKVEILHYSEDTLEAVVSGTEDYNVSIYSEDGEIEDMYCDCPYAGDENKCKHMAAVLYALEDLPEISEHDSDDINDLINEASPELMKEFLIKSMTYDEDLKYKFIRFLKARRKEISISEYKEHLEYLLISYADGEDHIDYRYSFQFFNEADELLTECTDILIAEKRYYDAYDIVKYYWYKLSITDIDDDGNFSIFYDTCMEIFKEITQSADIETKRRIFNELTDMLSTKLNYIFEMVFDFISKGFDEKEFLLKMLEYTDKRLEKKDTPERRKKWILYRLQLMDKLNYSDDDILEYSRRYPEFREIREYLTERFIAKGNNEAAIKIIEETLGSEVNSIYESQRLHLELKELYKQTNDREKYIKELWVILTQLCISGMDIYREFKSLFEPDEWEEERELLYSSMKYQHMLPEYFVEEKLYDRLASYVFTNKNEYLVEEYEKYLADEYHELILAEYAEYLNKSAEQSADRATYQRWADKLIHMKTLKGGKECVAEIIENWKTLYRNRPAMMQEIDRVMYEE